MAYKRISINLPFEEKDIYNIIIDISNYPNFIPHCSKVEINNTSASTNENEILAIMHIDYLTIFKTIHLEYASRITLQPNSYKVFIEEYPKKFFSTFESSWEIRKAINGCEIIYDIKFEIKNPLLNITLSKLFIDGSKKMVEAFTKRAYNTLTPIK